MQPSLVISAISVSMQACATPPLHVQCVWYVCVCMHALCEAASDDERWQYVGKAALDGHRARAHTHTHTVTHTHSHPHTHTHTQPYRHILAHTTHDVDDRRTHEHTATREREDRETIRCVTIEGAPPRRPSVESSHGGSLVSLTCTQSCARSSPWAQPPRQPVAAYIWGRWRRNIFRFTLHACPTTPEHASGRAAQLLKPPS